MKGRFVSTVFFAVLLMAIVVAAGSSPAQALAVGGENGYLAADKESAVFEDERISLDVATVIVADQVYTGALLEPEVSVILDGEKIGPDCYKVAYADNLDAGVASVTVEGVGAYSGTASASFTIGKAPIARCGNEKIRATTYAGTAIEPKLHLSYMGKALVEGESFAVKYIGNKNAGTATVIAKGMGNFRGTKRVRFSIKRAPVKLCSFARIPDKVYSGAPCRPGVKPAYKGRKLKLARDYSVAFRANNRIGKAYAVVKGRGNFKGTKTLSFRLLDWVSPLDVARDTRQLITVEARGLRATVTMHEKKGKYWRETVKTSEGWLGADGLGDAREGVAYTPRGIMYPDRAFGIEDDPGCAMGYLKVDWSHWWNGDSSSSTYNRLVSTRDRSDFYMGASEHLIECGYVYDYCLNMGWNAACVPHGGSAFFMHCSGGRPTGGCVSVPKSTMVSILRHIRSGCVIAIDKRSALERY